MNRKKFTPVTGKTYQNHGGGMFRCLCGGYVPGKATMQNVKSGWTFVAHGCGIYEDDSIDWDYSTDGIFEKLSARE